MAETRYLIYRRVTELTPGPAKLLGLIADFELHHERPRRAAALLRQALRRLRLRLKVRAAGTLELESLADSLARWPYLPLSAAMADAMTLAVGYHRLGRRRLDQGRLEGAMTFLRLSQRALLQAMPAAAPESVPLALRLSREFLTLHLPNEAVGLVDQTRDLVRSAQAGKALTAQCLGVRADLRAVAGEIDQAVEDADHSLGLYRRLLDDGHPGLVPALRRCARSRLAVGEIAAARRHLDEALRLLGRCAGTRYPLFPHYLSDLTFLRLRAFFDKR